MMQMSKCISLEITHNDEWCFEVKAQYCASSIGLYLLAICPVIIIYAII